MPASALTEIPVHRHARAEEMVELRSFPRRYSLEIAAGAAERHLLRNPINARALARIDERTNQAEEAKALEILINDANDDDSDDQLEAVPDLSGSRRVQRRDEVTHNCWLSPGDTMRNVHNDYALGEASAVGE